MKINLDINRSEPILETINLRQGDGGLRTIDIQITENNQPIAITGYTLQFEANLPSGSMVQHAGVIKDATAGLFSYTFTSSDTSEAGQLPVAYFRLYDSAKNSVATRNIRIVVDRAADITQSQATEYLANVDKLVTNTSAKLASNNQQIAAQQAQIESIKSNGLMFGGRNYLLDSAKLNSGWYKNSSSVDTVEIIKEDGVNNAVLHIKNASNSTVVGLFSFPTEKMSIGNTIVLSIMARGHGVLWLGDFGLNKLFTIDSNDYKKVFVTGIVNTDGAFVIYPRGVGETWYHSPKLELGNIPSDWTQAPEDYLARIAALEQAILNK